MSAVKNKSDFSSTWKPLSPNLRLDFLENFSIPEQNLEGLGELGGLPVAVQESVVVKELLLVLQGFSGCSYIRPLQLNDANAVREFHVDSSMDPALKQAVLENLPLAQYYSFIARFVDSGADREKGMVVHAFAHALRGFIKEYRSFFVELDGEFRKGQLTLHIFAVRIIPFFAIVKLLGSITNEISINSIRGGALISFLEEKIRLCCEKKETIHILFLILKKSAIPFLRMLTDWMFEGNFEDPYGEFMIGVSNPPTAKQKQKTGNEQYRFVFEMVPNFLTDCKEKVLKSGNYWNIIRQCEGKETLMNHSPPMFELHEDHEILEASIDEAFTFAGESLLRLMRDKEDLNGKLRSLKHFYFLDLDDFLPDFLHKAARLMLHSWNKTDEAAVFLHFDDALRSSVLYSDRHRKMFRPVILRRDPLIEPGVPTDAASAAERGEKTAALFTFNFDCAATYPFYLIFTDTEKQWYQMLFQLFFRVKLVEYCLGRIRIKFVNVSNDIVHRYSWSLVEQILDFIKNLQQYFYSEVIEPLWHDMMEKILRAKTFDEVVLEHRDFLLACMQECFLGQKAVLKLLLKVLDASWRYCDNLLNPRFYETMDVISEVDRMRTRFTTRMLDLLWKMNDSMENRELLHKLSAAMKRLDGNDFYAVKVREHNLERSHSQPGSSQPNSETNQISARSDGSHKEV